MEYIRGHVEEEQLSLFGRIPRVDSNDPLRNVLFEPWSEIPRVVIFRRQGQPRKDRLKEAFTNSFGHLNCPPEEREDLKRQHTETSSLNKTEIMKNSSTQKGMSPQTCTINACLVMFTFVF
jgi:hypothetical protein